MDEEVTFSHKDSEYLLRISKGRPNGPARRLIEIQNGKRVFVRTSQTLLAILDVLTRDDTPHRVVTNEELMAALWPEKKAWDTGALRTQITNFRRRFGDSGPTGTERTFLFEERGHGYCLVVPFKRRPITDSPLRAGTEHKDRWDQKLFDWIIDRITPANDGQPDLRLMSSMFFDATDIDMHNLLTRGLAVQVLTMNPANQELMYARYGARKDEFELPLGALQRKLNKQIQRFERDFDKAKKDVEAWTSGGGAGRLKVSRPKPDLDVKVSDVMPVGFLCLTRRVCVVSLMPAHTNYKEAQMLIGDNHSQLWKDMNMDWQERWNARPFVKAVADGWTGPS